jgi:HlyD family secretion protein
VAEVPAVIGQAVTEGQTLATLDQTSLPQTVILAQTELVNAQQALDDLLNSEAARANAQQNVIRAEQAVIEANRALDVFDEARYKDDLDQARQDVVDREDDLQDAQDDFEPYQDWDPDNATYKDYKQKLDDAQNAYDEAVRVVDEMELAQEQAQADLESAQAFLADSQRELEQVQDGPNPDDVAALEARVAAAQATLDLAQITAPFAGTITNVEVMPGDQVAPASPAFRLDDLGRLLVDVYVSEVDINRIQPGQPVILTFDAILNEEYHGLVSEVAQVGVVNQGVTEFLVTVELTDADEQIKPGMTAAVNITVEQLDNVLLVPNRAVRVVDGQRVVYILVDNELVPVEITLGSSSDSASEVVDGELTSGDVIVLNPPQVFDTMGGPFGGN